MPSAVATSPSQVVSPALDPSVAMAIVPVLPTVAESSPSSPSPSLPKVVTASVPLISPSVNVLHACPPCSIGKSPKRATRSSVVSASSPVASSPLPSPNTQSIPPLKSPVKPSLTKTPKTRSASKPNPKLTPPPKPAPQPQPNPTPKPQPKP
ncbi:vegetative cell wall protein gp1-like [Humulus lupulus]|uniref:vegetative cell wall protein gp1-like n=1 Tax=Humulus lupulus TaxID=3486 RepID=UPI002B403B16|nr:vegetative cell wall protein gp1-like [Humulus lupulus]